MWRFLQSTEVSQGQCFSIFDLIAFSDKTSFNRKIVSSIPNFHARVQKENEPHLSFYNDSITIFPTSSIFKDFKSANGRFIPTNSNTGSSSRPSTRTMKFPLPGLSLFISTSEVHPCADRYLTIALARVLNTDHLGCVYSQNRHNNSPCSGNNGRGNKRSYKNKSSMIYRTVGMARQ